MPVDFEHSRFGTRGRDTHRDALGAPVIWTCPSCGTRNEGRRPEQGCGQCGAGDPRMSRAGQANVERPRGVEAPGSTASAAQSVDSSELWKRQGDVEHSPRPLRILRLVEYLITPGQDADEVLRRSLVGTLRFPWGQLTGTIVDSIDTNQDDRLRLARMQPGVWLANPIAQQLGGFDSRQAGRAPENPTGGGERRVAPSPGTLAQEPLTMPDTGASYTHDDALTARRLFSVGGHRLCYTLALALGGIAEELAGNSEPEKFLSREECLRLASALLAIIPPEWQGDQAEPPPPAPGDGVDAATRLAQVQQASKPTATPWVDPATTKTTKL